MERGDIPAEVQQFVIKYIRSIAYLEGLMLLSRSPDALWTDSAVARRLYIAPGEAQLILGALCRDGFARETDGQYRFECPPSEDAELIRRLDSVYSRALIPLTQLIHSNRASRVIEFANAFRLKKEK